MRELSLNTLTCKVVPVRIQTRRDKDEERYGGIPMRGDNVEILWSGIVGTLKN
jgi:hypothetical protein